MRRIAPDSHEPNTQGSQTVYSLSKGPSKILKKRVFVRIGEFHSAPKRASGGVGGMRGAGADGRGLPFAGSPANMAAEALFEV